jgi:hypothetical protein
MRLNTVYLMILRVSSVGGGRLTVSGGYVGLYKCIQSIYPSCFASLPRFTLITQVSASRTSLPDHEVRLHSSLAVLDI